MISLFILSFIADKKICFEVVVKKKREGRVVDVDDVVFSSFIHCLVFSYSLILYVFAVLVM